MSSHASTATSAMPQLNGVAQYLLALAVTIGVYSIYLKFAVPAIEGPRIRRSPSAQVAMDEFELSGIDKSNLHNLLPAGAWELSECKTLLTESGTVFFQDFETIDETSILVSPFTMITGNGMQTFGRDVERSSSSKAPTILRCQEGAILKFDEPVAQIFHGKSKMRSARLAGSVDIHRPASKPDQSDSIDILTSNIQIDMYRIYTLDEVQFSFGPHRGRGRNLLIDLAHETDIAGGSDDFSNIAGIQRLELAFLDLLRIETPTRKSMFKSAAQTAAVNESTEQLFSNRTSPLDVSCTGPFVFEFETQTASFQENVVARQLDGSGNQIRCDQLSLVFDSRTSPGSIRSTGAPDHQLRQFVAIGNPAQVVSNSQPARVTADYLSYDVLANQIDANCDPSTDRMVTLVSPELQLVSKQLSYIIPKDGSIGPIRASGPGRLLRVGSKDQDEFFVTWTKELVSNQVADQKGLQKIIVRGDTKILIGNETRVDSNRLEWFVWQFPVNKTPDANNPIQESNNTKWAYKPARLISRGDVKIDSPKISGSADQITVTWPESTPNATALSIHSASTVHRTLYRGEMRFQDSPFVSPLTSTQPNLKTKRTRLQPIHRKPATHTHFVQQVNFESDPESTVSKINFRGSQVDIRLIEQTSKTTIGDLTIVDNVQVSQTGSSPSKPNSDFLITGQRLQMIPQAGKSNYRILVSGDQKSLARIVGKDFELDGQKINLDQVANKLWVDGAGAMKVKPSPVAPSTTNLPPNGSTRKKTTPESLDVQWNGGMIFDGSKIYFENDVVMKTQLASNDEKQTVLRTFCQGLRVELKQSVDFQALTQNQKIADPEIHELVFVDHVPSSKVVFKQASFQNPVGNVADIPPVVVKIQTMDADMQPVEQMTIRVPQVTVGASGGTINSDGPGTLAIHRSNESSKEKPTHVFSSLAKKGKATEIAFVQINFDGSLKLDSNQNEMKIDGNVRTLYVPVQSWDETHDPDDLQSRVPGGVHLTSEHLQLAQWQPRNQAKPTNEIMAWGNAHLLSDTFEATGDRVSYSQASDTMTIEGTPRTSANLWFKSTPNALNPEHLIAEKITYRLRDQFIQINDIKNIN